MQQGDFPAAEKSFVQVLRLVPNDVGARINLGVAFMRQQNWTQALAYLNQAEKLAPQVTGIRLNIGLIHYRQGAYAAAIPDFDNVLKRQPDSIQARRLLGLCYLFKERYADAASDLEPLWPLANTDVSYLYSLSIAAGNSGRLDLEAQATKQLMSVGNNSPLVHLLLGKADMAHRDYDGALIELQKAAAADPKLPMVHYNLGIAYRHKGDSEKAQSEFLKDAAMEPGVAFNYDQLGFLASTSGNDRQAEAYFSDAVKRDPKLGTSWYGLAKSYKQEKRYDDALKALVEANSIDPKSASVHYLRAQVLAALGRKKEAAAEFSTVHSLEKDTVDNFERKISGSSYTDPDLPAQ